MRIALAATIAALAVSTASAADLEALRPSIPGQPEATRTIDWSGPEFGLTGGGDWLDADFSLLGYALDKENFDGGHVGGFAGYQYQFGNDFVLGLEGDVYRTWNEKSYVSDTIHIGTDWSGSLRARFGYAFDRLLVYATGGVVVTRAYLKEDGYPDENKNFTGYAIGAGLDYAVTDNVFLRAEYRYNHFQSEKTFGVVDTDLDQHLLNVGLGMKF